MADHEVDLLARKQLLLTRIALQRVQWGHDMAVLGTAASPRHIMTGAARSILPDAVGDVLFQPQAGPPSAHPHRSVAASVGAGVMQAVLIARRYPVLVSLVGAILARRTIRRVLIVGTLGTAVAAGVWIFRSSRPSR